MSLFDPVALGRLQLASRIVMAPMTRSRAGEGAVPTKLMAEYYGQRAGAGLIITEGIAPSPEGLGYCRTPGLYSEAQVAGWRDVCDTVHARGGRIVAQLMHVGRVASHFNKPSGAQTIAPSAITAKGEIYTDEGGMQPLDAPRALELEEIMQVVEDYARAARNAYDAGFDGVELHCTSGYLPAQFLSTGTNQRTDAYGGGVENRCRFVLDVLSALSDVDGADRVGMRICPGNPFNDLYDDDPQQTFEHLLGEAASLSLAYLHVIRMPAGLDNLALGRRFFGDRLIVNESYSQEDASQAVAAGEASAVSFGRLFIANPDLPARFAAGLPLSKWDSLTLYTPGPAGYTDYPFAE